jgi:hypothetical protein
LFWVEIDITKVPRKIPIKKAKKEEEGVEKEIFLEKKDDGKKRVNEESQYLLKPTLNIQSSTIVFFYLEVTCFGLDVDHIVLDTFMKKQRGEFYVAEYLRGRRN